MQRSATFDGSRRYRFRLTRSWDAAGLRVAFVLLNPSRADARQDDPTLRRCIGFARAWGFGSLEVVNLFAFRTPHPQVLRHRRRPVGRGNDRYVLAAARRSQLTVLAWGNAGAWRHRDQEVLGLLRQAGCALACLGVTRLGQPRHVLYLPGHLRPTRLPTSQAQTMRGRSAARPG